MVERRRGWCGLHSFLENWMWLKKWTERSRGKGQRGKGQCVCVRVEECVKFNSIPDFPFNWTVEFHKRCFESWLFHLYCLSNEGFQVLKSKFGKFLSVFSQKIIAKKGRNEWKTWLNTYFIVRTYCQVTKILGHWTYFLSKITLKPQLNK